MTDKNAWECTREELIQEVQAALADHRPRPAREAVKTAIDVIAERCARIAWASMYPSDFKRQDVVDAIQRLRQ